MSQFGRREQAHISCCTRIIPLTFGLIFCLKMEVAAPAKTLVKSTTLHGITLQKIAKEKNISLLLQKLFCTEVVKCNIINVIAGDTYNNKGASKAYIYKHFSFLRRVLHLTLFDLYNLITFCIGVELGL
jgi:hypothetical protein